MKTKKKRVPDFGYEIDTTQIGNGRHMLSLNVCDHKGHSGTDTIPIEIENYPPSVGQGPLRQYGSCVLRQDMVSAGYIS